MGEISAGIKLNLVGREEERYMKLEERIQRVVNGVAWNDYCDALKKAGEIILADDVPNDPLTRAEGFRYLSRLSRVALEKAVEAESSDPSFPFFYQLANKTAKIGADNPDNRYLNASIRGDFDYRISGRLGTMFYFAIVANAMRYDIDGTCACTGSLMKDELELGPDGEVEIIASMKEPKSGNWLRLEEDTSMIIVRESALDWETERPGDFTIERIGGPDRPRPLQAADLEKGLRDAAAFVHGTAHTFAEWTRMFRENVNQFPVMDQQFFQDAGGSPDLFYYHTYFELAEDEAWVIETEVPECYYWNFQLDNWWMESLDYRFHKVTLNKHSATLEPDNTLRIVCCDSDPGVGNWIDTAGHRTGTALLRWGGASEHPQPRAKVVKLSDLIS